MNMMKSFVGGYKMGGIKGAYHWVRCHVWNRYHVIDIAGEDGYDWGWIDRDHAMFIACFKLLKEFVEKEDPSVGLRSLADYEHPNVGPDERSGIEEQLKREKEVRKLYEWWVIGRSKEHAECERLVEGLSCHPFDQGIETSNVNDWHTYCQRSHELDEKDDEMLNRLMKIRRCLWT